MDKLNQPNQPRQQGMIGETPYNKPLQQPVRPVRPGQNSTVNSGNSVIQNGQVKQVHQVNTQQQQRAVRPQYNQQQYSQQQNFTRGVNYQQPVNQQLQQTYNTEQDNMSLAGRPKLTRLQREAQGLPSRNYNEQQYIGNRTLGQRNDYTLSNNNTDSFKVKHVKQEGIGFLLLPLSLVVLLAVIIVILLGDVILSINELKVNTTSLLNSEPISEIEFVDAAEKMNLHIDNKDLGGDISEVMAYKEDYSYEINYITFESSEETQAYYNYIIDIADESESSVSSSIVGQNSAESTLISKTYNGFMDITYIDNTIIIAIAYDSNKQTEVIEFMNNLGY